MSYYAFWDIVKSLFLHCTSAQLPSNRIIPLWQQKSHHLRCWFRLSLAFFRGRHTGQSCRVQFFQWEMICLEDAQWATVTRKSNRIKVTPWLIGFELTHFLEQLYSFSFTSNCTWNETAFGDPQTCCNTGRKPVLKSVPKPWWISHPLYTTEATIYDTYKATLVLSCF